MVKKIEAATDEPVVEAAADAAAVAEAPAAEDATIEAAPEAATDEPVVLGEPHRFIAPKHVEGSISVGGATFNIVDGVLELPADFTVDGIAAVLAHGFEAA